MTIHHARRGHGKPLLLVHGLGSSHAAWGLVEPALAKHREVIALDLPGHGASPAEHDSGTFGGITRSLEAWLEREKLAGIDMVGSSMGARLVLEMARRGRSGAVVALDPGGFWRGWERGSPRRPSWPRACSSARFGRRCRGSRKVQQPGPCYWLSSALARGR